MGKIETIEDLIELLHKSKMIVRKQLVSSDNTIRYVEVYNILSSEHFLLYIPTDLEMKTIKTIPIEKTTSIEIDEKGNLSEDYSENPTKFDLEQQYARSNDINAEFPSETSLEDTYRIPLSLTDPNQSETTRLKEIYRQLRRLQYMVSNISYKLVIFHKTFLCTIHRNDDIIFYKTSTDYGSKMRLLISTDLESLDSNLPTLYMDIVKLRGEIRIILEKNSVKNIQLFQSLLNKATQFNAFSQKVESKRSKIQKYLEELEELLQGVFKAEEANRQKIENEEYILKEKQKRKLIDLDKMGQIAVLTTESNKINRIKQKTLEQISILKTIQDDLDLQMDTILFDNIVMLASIEKNLYRVENL